MKNKIIYLICCLGFIDYGHAFIFGDEGVLEKSQQKATNSGAYKLTIKSQDPTKSFGGDIQIRQVNASLLKIDLETIIVVAAPLNCPQEGHEEVSRSLKICSNDENYQFLEIPPVKNPVSASYHSAHPFKKFDGSIETSSCSIKIFNNLKFYQDVYLEKICLRCLEKSQNQKGFIFENGFSTFGVYQEPLEHQREYPVKVQSFGSSFDRQLKTYKNGCYHETQMIITYDKSDDCFWKKSTSRSFYIKFVPHEKENHDRWFCSLLPESGDIVMNEEDSGALITTQDGQAMALVGHIDCQDFYDQNKEFYHELLTFQRSNKDDSLARDHVIHKDDIKSFVEFITSKIAQPDQMRHLELETQSSLDDFILFGTQAHLYGFTLKDGMKDLELMQQYLPLPERIKFKRLSRL